MLIFAVKNFKETSLSLLVLPSHFDVIVRFLEGQCSANRKEISFSLFYIDFIFLLFLFQVVNYFMAYLEEVCKTKVKILGIEFT